MELQLATTQEMSEAIKSIDGFTDYLKKQAEENPDKVYIFWNTLANALKPIVKEAKDKAILHQETYWELSGGYKMRVSVKHDYDYSYDEEWLILNAKLKAREEILRLEIDLEEKKGGTDHKKNSVSYTLVTPKNTGNQ